jgi:hypothetical protein
VSPKKNVLVMQLASWIATDNSAGDCGCIIPDYIMIASTRVKRLLGLLDNAMEGPPPPMVILSEKELSFICIFYYIYILYCHFEKSISKVGHPNHCTYMHHAMPMKRHQMGKIKYT